MKNTYIYSWLSMVALAAEVGFLYAAVVKVTSLAGNAGLAAGCLGMMSLLFGILGFSFGWMDHRILGKKYMFPILLMVIHGAVLIFLSALYLLGLVG